jgi:hypothetical protein
MSFDPTPAQTLLMLRLVFSGREPKLTELQPQLKPQALRDQLEREGLIRLERRGRARHVVVTEKGWAWTQARLDAPLNPQGANPGRALIDLLPRLKAFLLREGYTLADLFVAAGPRPPAEAPLPASAQAIDAQVRSALLALGSGQSRVRVVLADLREALPRLSRESLDASLMRLQVGGELVLYPEDAGHLRTQRVRDAEVGIAGSRYHIAYLLH